MAKTVIYHVNLDPSTIEDIRDISHNTGHPQREIIEQAIDLLKKKVKKQGIDVKPRPKRELTKQERG